MSLYNLNNTWILWNHSIDNKSWDNNSYENIFTIKNLFDYTILKDNLTTQNLKNSMFFIQKSMFLYKKHTFLYNKVSFLYKKHILYKKTWFFL